VSNFPKIPKRFSIIDEANRDEYAYILPGDECFYIWERMSHLWNSGARPDFSKYPTNGFIANFQIPVACKTENPYRYKHKVAAITFAAQALSELLPADWRKAGTFVPMPPSKIKDDPDHDPRLLRTLKAIKPPLADIRELVLQTENVDSKQKGLRPEDRSEHYHIDEELSDPEPSLIFVVDDVLTTGSHFKAVQTILARRFPGALVCGVFLARAVRPDEADLLSG
jgi:hypothetical protein